MRVPLSWLKQFVDIRIKPEELASILTMGGLEVEAVERAGDDTVFELGVTPNRADCLSVIGVAREIAALTKRALRVQQPKAVKGRGRIADILDVSVKSSRGCPRYSARVIKDVRIGPSPAWMTERLEACGIRSINNVVDATNYMMLETGQPFHAFDYRELRGSKIVVSNAKEPGRFTSLDDIERQILPEDLLICDGVGPIAIAGVMGGKNSEVSDNTKTIVLESAFFEPIQIRRTSKRLGLSSESSRRFERGVDPCGTVLNLNRLTSLICGMAGGTATVDWLDVTSQPIKPLKVVLQLSEVKRILGIELSLREVASLVQRLGMMIAAKTESSLTLKVPTYRPDVTRPIDVVEEVARLHGYHRIRETMPRADVKPIVRPKFVLKEQAARNALIGCGFSEAVTLAFTNSKAQAPFAGLAPTAVEIANPLSTDEAVMRTSLLPGLLKALAVNTSRQRHDIKLFSLGRVYHKMAGNQTEEPLYLAGIMTGKGLTEDWGGKKECVDFYDAKGAVETVLKSLGLEKQSIWQRTDDAKFLHQGRSAHLLVSNKRAGYVGQLHPEVAHEWECDEPCFVFELNLGMLAGLSLTERPQFSELSKFPFVERDLAILIDETIPSVEILRVIQDSGVALVSDVRIFDVYRGEGIGQGKKSMAYRIRYASSERTLTDEEVSEAHNTIVNALEVKLNAVLRT